MLGAVSSRNEFVYRTTNDNFSVKSYIAFLEDKVLKSLYRRNHRLFYIQDNASYHKAAETYRWFKANRKRIEVFNLPPYFPQLNASERIWHYTRCHATHNRYFSTVDELGQALLRTFKTITGNPNEIAGLMQPFF